MTPTLIPGFKKKYILFSIKSETIVKYITLCIRNVHTVLH